jgi:hypothetical protein
MLRLKAPAGRQCGIPVQNGTLTNVFWGLSLIWFGLVAAWLKGDFGATINAPVFAMGIGLLLLCMNLARSLLRLRLSVMTIALGILLTVANLVVIEFNLTVPFLPELLIIAGVALVIGSLRTRNYSAY